MKIHPIHEDKDEDKVEDKVEDKFEDIVFKKAKFSKKMRSSFYGKHAGNKSIRKKKKYERKRGKFLWENLRNAAFSPKLLKTWAKQYYSQSIIEQEGDTEPKEAQSEEFERRDAWIEMKDQQHI